MSQAEQVVRLVREVLGEHVVGAYLHGSAACGGLRASSDVDILVVTRRHTTTRQRRLLVKRLLDVSSPVGPTHAARPIELTIVVDTEVRPWRYPPSCEFQYGEWLREQFERGEVPLPASSPDLALLTTIVRLGNASLFGPPPTELLDPVPQRDLSHAIAAGVPELLTQLESDTRNVLLTLSRIWTSLATGHIRTKDAAADWALDRLPAEHRGVLARAQAGYRGDHDDHWSDLLPQVRSYADHVVAAIEQLSARTAEADDFANMDWISG